MATRSHDKQPPLARLTPRHRHAAALVAAGLPNQEVGRATGLSEFRVCHLKRDPLFAAEIAAAERELRSRVTEAVADLLLSDTPRTLSFLQAVRDGHLDELGGPTEPAALRVRTVAASVLLDRQVPRQRASLAETRTEHRVILTTEEVERFRKVMEEDDESAVELGAAMFSSTPLPVR
jgi:hypothetical protein